MQPAKRNNSEVGHGKDLLDKNQIEIDKVDPPAKGNALESAVAALWAKASWGHQDERRPHRRAPWRVGANARWSCC